MYDVTAVAGVAWSCPYAWKGLALVILGKEINGQESERRGERDKKRGFVTLPPP